MDAVESPHKACQCSAPDAHDSMPPEHRRHNKAQWLLIFLIRFYQSYLRLHLFGRCRYWPTCSEYGIACLETHGTIKGGWLTFKRILRCHPFCRGGIDPVPPKKHEESA